MLASTPNLLQMCSSFDATKSTKGASKLRRDLINSEIANLRDLLPLPSSTRQRLSQLQLMALVCVYVRKANYFQHAFRKHELMPHLPVTNFGFSKALSGFLMMMTQNGKLLYISDNAAEYLGHSMEDLLIHGDSVYDIIEKQDHQTIQNELVRASNPLNVPNDSRIFLCRMNVSRNSRRQMRFGDQKVVLVQGHFVSYLPLCSRNEPVFLATCTPVAMPETRECVVQGSTNVFTSIHSMDMKFIHLDANGEFHLGYNKNQLKNLSWYDIVHWENLSDAQSKHRLITQSEQERSCILLLRLQTSSTTWIWVHVVLQVKDNNENSQQPVIVCTNQVLSDKEAAVMQANSWLYQFYSLHSKLHYTMQNSNVSVSGSASATSTPVPSHSPTSPTGYEAATSATSCSRTRASSFTSPAPYTAAASSSAFSGQHSTAHHAYHSVPTAGSEAPSLALHPSHPHNMSYYHGQSAGGMGVSVSTSPSSQQYAGHFGAHPSLQQYSPQAGTLPYQAMPGQTSSISGSTSAATPPATSQTEVRVKEEPSASTPPRASKRTRSSSGHQEEEGGKQRTAKNQKKNGSAQSAQNAQSEHSSSNGNSITAVNGSTAGGFYSSSSYGNSSASQHSGYHSAYHPTSSVFGSTSFTPSDLSSMMPAYYGGSMSYHHHHHHHHHPHSQLAYPHHHFQGKFSFFEHGAAGSSSSLTGGSSTSFEHRQPSTHTSTRSADSRGCSEESTALLSSAHFGSSSLHQLNSKPKGALYHAGDSSLADRRELDKVRSPESITSATSDYGSMSSQSPPSSFEKPFPSLPPLAESLDYSRAHYPNALKANWPAYHPSHHHQSSAAAAAAAAAAASASAEKPTEERSSLPFSMSFQFWPGYSSSTAELSSYEAQHRHTHLPPTASTFPVDSLLHSHSSQTTAAVYGAAGNLFAAYGEGGNAYEAESKSALVNRSSASFRAHSIKAESNKMNTSAAASAVKPSQAPASSAIAVTRAL